MRHDQPSTAYALVKGCLAWWWPVLGSNQRRLSQRCRTPLTFKGRTIFAYQPYAHDVP
jgi:hypothetical protein